MGLGEPADPGPSGVQPATHELDVEVVCSVGPGEVSRRSLRLPPGSVVADALRAAAAAGLPVSAIVALWGRRCSPQTALRPGDRVECLRPLVVDPKESRRLRYRRTGGRQGGIERGAARRGRSVSGNPSR